VPARNPRNPRKPRIAFRLCDAGYSVAARARTPAACLTASRIISCDCVIPPIAKCIAV
jgi:hypothetical protein